MQPSDAASPYGQHALAPSGERIGSEAQQTVSDQACYGKAPSYTATTREIHAASTPAGSLTLAGPDWGLSDDQREDRIESLGALMVTAMELWESTGEFGYRGDADRLRIRMEALIKSRPASFVRGLEVARGLACA